VDGLERTFTLNQMAYFVLTHRLRERLIASAPARIVNTASSAHQGQYLDFNDLQMEKHYRARTAYGRSKRANIPFTRELARGLTGTGVTAGVHQVLARSVQRRKHVIRIKVRLFYLWLAKLNHRLVIPKNQRRQPELLEPACQLLTAESTASPKPWGLIATALLALQPTLFVLAGLYGMLVARTGTLVPRPDELSPVEGPVVTVFWTVVQVQVLARAARQRGWQAADYLGWVVPDGTVLYQKIRYS
jgi:hypothetical protein